MGSKPCRRDARPQLKHEHNLYPPDIIHKSSRLIFLSFFFFNFRVRRHRLCYQVTSICMKNLLRLQVSAITINHYQA